MKRGQALCSLREGASSRLREFRQYCLHCGKMPNWVGMRRREEAERWLELACIARKQMRALKASS